MLFTSRVERRVRRETGQTARTEPVHTGYGDRKRKHAVDQAPVGDTQAHHISAFRHGYIEHVGRVHISLQNIPDHSGKGFVATCFFKKSVGTPIEKSCSQLQGSFGIKKLYIHQLKEKKLFQFTQQGHQGSYFFTAKFCLDLFLRFFPTRFCFGKKLLAGRSQVKLPGSAPRRGGVFNIS